MKKLMLLILPAMFFFACNNADTKTEKDECCDKDKKEECSDVCKKDVMTVETLMASLEEKVDQEVVVCGKCTHICDHSGRNIFVNSFENEEVVIVGKAGEGIEKFDKALEGKDVVVKGKLIAVEVEHEDELEVHHDVELNYYIEVTEVSQCSCEGKCKNHDKTAGCCKGNEEHKCNGEHKQDHKCCGDHEKKHENCKEG
ncbi:MAG: hypothetical protein JXR36_02805 [Bacteroidales bacterium]|nr:hypothetical protein [Bacteroidales bacterium]